jgi:hypothetical protein
VETQNFLISFRGSTVFGRLIASDESNSFRLQNCFCTVGNLVLQESHAAWTREVYHQHLMDTMEIATQDFANESSLQTKSPVPDEIINLHQTRSSISH